MENFIKQKFLEEQQMTLDHNSREISSSLNNYIDLLEQDIDECEGSSEDLDIESMKNKIILLRKNLENLFTNNENKEIINKNSYSYLNKESVEKLIYKFKLLNDKRGLALEYKNELNNNDIFKLDLSEENFLFLINRIIVLLKITGKDNASFIFKMKNGDLLINVMERGKEILNFSLDKVSKEKMSLTKIEEYIFNN